MSFPYSELQVDHRKSIKSILTYLDIKADIKSDCKQLYRKVSKTLISKFTVVWKEKNNSNHGENMHKSNKLRTYAFF